MRDEFEQMVIFISPYDPVACKRDTSKRPHAENSAAYAGDGNLNDKNMGNTGVELH